MMQIKEIIQYLETIAPLSYQENYDNAGLLIGDQEKEISHVLLTIDVTEEIIAEALQRNCNFIIAHHPVIFGGVKKLTGSNYVERIVMNAVKHDIAIYAAHTNLDNMQHGVSSKIADKLGLMHCQILSPLPGSLKKLFTFVPHGYAAEIRNALFAAGAGHIGQYSECSFNTPGTGTFKALEGSNPFVGAVNEQHHEPETKVEIIFPAHLQSQIIDSLLENHPYEEPAYDIISLDNTNQLIGSGMIGELEEPMDELSFLKLIKEKMKTGCIRHTRLLNKKIKKVAVCGGAGRFLLPKAIRAGAEILVTADFKYHDFFDADNQIIIADIGHYESEQFTMELFYSLLTEKFANFAPLITNINTNPVNYLS